MGANCIKMEAFKQLHDLLNEEYMGPALGSKAKYAENLGRVIPQIWILVHSMRQKNYELATVMMMEDKLDTEAIKGCFRKGDKFKEKRLEALNLWVEGLKGLEKGLGEEIK